MLLLHSKELHDTFVKSKVSVMAMMEFLSGGFNKRVCLLSLDALWRSSFLYKISIAGEIVIKLIGVSHLTKSLLKND